MVKATVPENYPNNVFLNCPFDDEYQDLFRSIIFAIQDCGFLPRCALEVSDSGDTRIDKIVQIIRECKYGIHDISRTELSSEHQLPRFNMPLELGIFLGAKRFGQKEQTEKRCLILDREPHRYQKFCSDIAGQDILVHNQQPSEAIKAVRDWLSSTKPEGILPGSIYITERYDKFCSQLPNYCEMFKQTVEELTFKDFRLMVIEWLEDNEG
jgi:hypothetical protein